MVILFPACFHQVLGCKVGELDTSFQQIIRPLENPIKATGHIQILYGNLAPEGSVAKITGKEGLYFSGLYLFLLETDSL